MTKFTWVYKDFSSATLPSFARYSPAFSPENNNEISIEIGCHPSYSSGFFNNFKYTHIYFSIPNGKNISFRYKMSILNANGDKCETQEGEAHFSTKNHYSGVHLFEPDYLNNPANGLLVNGNLTIYCEIGEINENEYSDEGLVAKNPIVQDYQSLLESAKFSDASLIVGVKEFKIHKAILSARSKVFAAMFENDCEEKRQNRVEITDISVEVCEQMLNYIYTGQIASDMSEYATDLFAAADKYQLEHLKAACEKHLCATLNIEYAATTLLLADMHHATLLKLKCIDYITDNLGKVMDTKGWKVLTVVRIELTLDLLKKLAITK